MEGKDKVGSIFKLRFIQTLILIGLVVIGVVGSIFFFRFFLLLLAGIMGVVFILVLFSGFISLVERVVEKVKLKNNKK
ncbi:MAG TPA: hypothetical protein ENG47_04690 [Candidatus Aerophobetes bacterium]|uniref:Uncharacterized protein n=1 Tax=Aerophobetes bacterium TaxID=2030807 RepID=A0A662DGX6_UNCAE|nr:MAG: hypothetical protein DRI96_00435 [Candidatus Aerophobetes bacterium]HDN85034.1 hypothetical protein [Candidatus Aerophobetes bacterium]